MFEQYTEDYFLDEAKSLGEELGVDTRQGSIYMDAAAGHCLRAAKFMADLSTVFEMLAVDTCTGEILEEKAGQDGIVRHPSTQSYWNVNIEGAMPDNGTRFFCQSYYFKMVTVDGLHLLESEVYGAETNALNPGETVIPVYNLNGLTSCTLGTLYTPGADAESDDSLRQRWKEKKSGPSDNGNKTQFKAWCESVSGVGIAHIIPLFGGENTVRAVLYSTTGEKPAAGIIKAVQDYIDPIVDGYSVVVNGVTYVFGDGLGEGVANIGAHFLATEPDEVLMSVTFDADLKSGYTKSQAQAEVLNKVKDYVANLVLNAADTLTVRLSNIGSIILSADAITDYTPSSLMINGSTDNLSVNVMQVPIVKEVIIND
nr:MAG TPA: Baseplate J like protein [Caudoviricetes sp.]